MPFQPHPMFKHNSVANQFSLSLICRVHFGSSCACPSVFPQLVKSYKRNEETFGDISGLHVIADDFIIAMADHQEHDHIMRLILTRAREKGVRFNKDKIQFKIASVQYMGHIVSAQVLACFKLVVLWLLHRSLCQLLR